MDSRKIDYTKLDYKNISHFKRWEKRVNNLKPKLVCQDCRGMGGETDEILEYGQGPWVLCRWCEGVGYVDSYRRGQWLMYKKFAKNKNI